MLDVRFTDTSTDEDGTIASWAWDFGDGTTSTEQNPTHTYATSGTYDVTLTVTDNLSLESTTPASQPVTVVNEAPVANFTFDVNVLDVKFTDTSTDEDGTIASWAWDFGDGSAISTDQNPTHIYTEAGTYPVTLTVTDDRGLASTQVSQDVTVKFDEAVFCSEGAPPVTGGEGAIATTATFFRGENGDKFDFPCEDVGVIVDIVDDDYVFWDNSNVGVFGNPQAVNGLVTIEWAPVPVAEAERLEREIDYVGDGLEFISTPWCTSFERTTDPDTGKVTFDVELPDYSGPGSILVTILVDGVEVEVEKAPWCLVSDERILDGGEIDQTVVLFGGGDPRMR